MSSATTATTTTTTTTTATTTTTTVTAAAPLPQLLTGSGVPPSVVSLPDGTTLPNFPINKKLEKKNNNDDDDDDGDANKNDSSDDNDSDDDDENNTEHKTAKNNKNKMYYQKAEKALNSGQCYSFSKIPESGMPYNDPLLTQLLLDSKTWNSYFRTFQAPSEVKPQSFYQWYQRCTLHSSSSSSGFPHPIERSFIGIVPIGFLDIDIPLSLIQKKLNIHTSSTINPSHNHDIKEEKETLNTSSNTNTKTDITTTSEYIPLLEILREGIELFYQMPVKILYEERISLEQLKALGRKYKTESIHPQLESIRKKYNKMFCVMGIIGKDLCSNNFSWVFGHTNHKKGTSIVSFVRYSQEAWSVLEQIRPSDIQSNPQLLREKLNESMNQKEWCTFVRRIVKVTTHEVGHLFGISHCPFFKCGMNRSWSQSESDSKPLEFCPVCLYKVYFSRLVHYIDRNTLKNSNEDNPYPTSLDLIKRYNNLKDFLTKYEFLDDSHQWFCKRFEFAQEIFNKIQENKTKIQ